MEIKAKCRYDYEAAKALVHLYAFRLKKTEPKKKYTLLMCCSAALALFCFWMLSLYSDLILVFVLFASIVLMGIQTYYYFALPRVRYNSMGKLKDIEQQYIFTEEGLQISSDSEAYQGRAVMAYTALEGAYETSRYFFLIKGGFQNFVVDKATIEGDGVSGIRRKLQSYMKENYVICNY